MSYKCNDSVRKKDDFKLDYENIAEISDSGNSENEINIFSQSDADSKSIVKADAEQEQEQEQEIIIEEEG
ncbi:hypothetical protein [Metabacillus endolithicus]|uniref:Uncharacterized protein n=1 Tax=Metabacillus endolithicus TaxID=1535204 RepID=A0ABW5C6Q1_9BACI|nr:hypothetical protein [Metabacillus endolithicus]UPG63889.1 hypothetical protein MVE64_01660 [Metabacillus endolithicus]